MSSSGRLGAALIHALTRPVAVLPLSFHRRMGRSIGRFLRNVIHYRTDIVAANMARCFPEMEYWELKEASRKFYEHLGTVFCEAIWFGGHSARKLKESEIVRMENAELFNRLYDNGKSVFVMASHNGNWELYGGIKQYADLSFPENDLCATYRELSNRAMDRFMTANRIHPVADKKGFDGLVESFDVLRYAISHRRTRKLYIFITDQHPYSRSSRVPVCFMGRETVSMDGSPALAHRLAMPVVYVNMKVNDDGNYTIVPTLIAEDASQMSVSDILARYYQLLEEDIKAQPWNWLWTHKRWK